MVDYAEELLAPRAIAEAGPFDRNRAAKLVEKFRENWCGAKDNMACVEIVSTQLVVSSFVQSCPKEKGL